MLSSVLLWSSLLMIIVLSTFFSVRAKLRSLKKEGSVVRFDNDTVLIDEVR